MCAELRTLAPRSRQRGLSLIELMVGIVVALLVGIAASGSAIFFTAAQRQGMGTSGALINTTTALSAIKEDLAQVGLGFFGQAAFLCPSLNVSVDANDFSTNTFSPLTVTRTGNFDDINVVYANEVAGGANVILQDNATATAATLQSYLPATAGAAVLFMNSAATRCTVRSVTQVVAATTDTPQSIGFDGAGTHNQVAFGTPGVYVRGDRVALLGALAWQRYRVDNGNLLIERRFEAGSSVLVRNVVAFRAQYGVTAAGTTTITSWVDPTGGWAMLTAATLPQLRAVRLGIVTRSTQAEKRDANGNCTASEALPQLFGADVTGLPADWACFRYRTSIVTVPLRNVALGLRPDGA
jgi:type IV pilus assembly protein PilW